MLVLKLTRFIQQPAVFLNRHKLQLIQRTSNYFCKRFLQSC